MTLDQLAIKHGTDKSSKHHNYAVIYEQYFSEKRNKGHVKFVECGIGGYENPNAGGQSLRMWREWFPSAEIIGIDIHPKSFRVEETTQYTLSQTNERLSIICKGADIFIDDASHINPLTIKTFELVWPVLAPGAFYVIEDIESSWCAADGWAQGCDDTKDMHAITTVNYFRALINAINYKYTGLAHNCGIESMHFHENIVIIKKK